jgi:hypothetical protein
LGLSLFTESDQPPVPPTRKKCNKPKFEAATSFQIIWKWIFGAA